MPKRQHPHHRRSAIKELKDWALARWKFYTIIIAGIGLVFGTVTKVSESWEYIGPKLPPTTEYMQRFVNDKIGTTNQILRELQVDFAHDKLEAAKRDFNNTQAKTLEPLYKENSSYRDMVDRNAAETRDTIDRLQKQLRTLDRIKSQDGP